VEDQKFIYTVVINGKPEGPYAFEQLITLKITPGTFLRKPGMDDYKEAHEFPEIRELLGFTFEQTAPQYFASFDQRLLALVIDYFLITTLYILLAVISFFFIEDKSQRISVVIIVLPLIYLTKVIYGIIIEASAQQATIGKRLVNIKVTDLIGNRISLSTSFVRNIAKLLSALPFFFGYLYSFLNKKQQCWHDIAANTLVIKERLL
jgi:uncharacterized RDD family membrane protein YckC